MSDKIGRFPLKVSGTVVRIVAAQVFVLAVLALVFHNAWLTLALVLDFGIRALVTPLVSPLRIIGSYGVLPLLNVRDAPVFFSPKRFAATIGFGLSTVALIGFVAGMVSLAVGALALLSLFSFLEASVGFCAGCKIYGFLMRHGVIPESWCPECVGL